MPDTTQPPADRDGYGRSYRAAQRLTRWPVGTVYRGEVLPSEAPCTIVFPDVLQSELGPFMREMKDEIARNRLLVGLPVLGATHVGQNLDHRAFVVLPPVAEAKNLEAHVRRSGPLKPLLALQIAVMIADALARLHYRVRALGELRPWQVLLPESRRESLRLFDLGIPRGLWKRTIAPPRLDPHFTSLSVQNGHAPTAADDVFVVGALLYFMLAGEPPPVGGSPFPPNRAALGPFASFLDGLLMQAMQPDPDRGAEPFDDMHRFARALRGARDLHRLSPSARQALLKRRAPVEEHVGIPGAERMPTGALGFVESDGPSFLTQADLESIQGRMDASTER
ncbi:MAG: hypothetical protein H6703_03750 [Myxococcales bacterium]|nr:hypothetical protein [Myxococcales bacterium]MCB9541546.1 hypothetical protein [Myxococcales bacterium]